MQQGNRKESNYNLLAGFYKTPHTSFSLENYLVVGALSTNEPYGKSGRSLFWSLSVPWKLRYLIVRNNDHV